MPKVTWTYERFLKDIVNNPRFAQFDYSNVKPEDVKGCRSKIIVICKLCNGRIEPRIYHHIEGFGSCPHNPGALPWTYDRFEKEIINNPELSAKFDYSNIKREDVTSCESIIKLMCRICEFIWSAAVKYHVANKNCRNCTGTLPWDYEKFQRKIKADDFFLKFDYSDVNPKDIVNGRSIITVKCVKCKAISYPTISNHINVKRGCQSCAGLSPWTYEEFIETVKSEVYDNFDYSMVKSEHITNTESEFPIKCKTCSYEWETCIHNHINHGYGCPNCFKSGKLKREPLCRKILEEYFGKSFPSVRSKFLRNPKTNICLELDGYNEELKIAFEHQGIQHYPDHIDDRTRSYFHLTDERIQYDQWKDEFKKEQCAKNGIQLIIIPYWIKEEKLKEFIINQTKPKKLTIRIIKQ